MSNKMKTAIVAAAGVAAGWFLCKNKNQVKEYAGKAKNWAADKYTTVKDKLAKKCAEKAPDPEADNKD